MKKQIKKRKKTSKYFFVIFSLSVLFISTVFTVIKFKDYINTYKYTIESENLLTTATYSDNSENVKNFSMENNDEIVIELTNNDINYYASLSYNERLTILYNEDYSLKDRVKIFLGDDINNVGLVYYDLITDEEILINENKTFIAASTYKVGLNVLAYYFASIGEIDLNDYITFTWDDYEEGTGLLQNNYYIGSYTIQDLLDLSLVYSDNIATNMLGRYLGGHINVRNSLYDLLDIDYDSSENILTANIETKILKYIYDNRNNSYFSHMLEALSNTEFNDRLNLYIPQEIVAHKVGTYDTNIHDAGIILTNSPYILTIYTTNIDNAEEKIAQISRAIYESKLTP